LSLTAGNLSQHLGVLESAGLIEVEKGYEGRRGRTWVTLTAAGRTALADEIGRLKLIIARIEAARGRPVTTLRTVVTRGISPEAAFRW
jgi:DNA-binding MarR family transcriptional regulator